MQILEYHIKPKRQRAVQKQVLPNLSGFEEFSYYPLRQPVKGA
jgi:hypothetical protein